MVRPLTVISLFAGCGGSSLGYKLADFKELLAVEWDDNAVETFRLNFPEIPIFHGDIAKLSDDECLKLANIKPSELDVLDGSPPCQGFSSVGKRRFADVRNTLFKEYVRLLKALQPKVFIMENVKGLIQGSMKQIYIEIIRTLKECGYKVKSQLMNAMYFNVPQRRYRVIIIGIREDLNIEPSHPRPKNNLITLRKAFEGLEKDGTEIYYPNWLLKACKEITRLETGPKTKLKAFIKYKGTKGGWINYCRLSWDYPSVTLCKTFISCAFLGHPDDQRFINASECKRIGSFPDSFKFIGDFKQVVARIGNSVPPNMMRAIAEHVKENVLLKVGNEAQ